jgi:hypothetical protein
MGMMVSIYNRKEVWLIEVDTAAASSCVTCTGRFKTVDLGMVVQNSIQGFGGMSITSYTRWMDISRTLG